MLATVLATLGSQAEPWARVAMVAIFALIGIEAIRCTNRRRTRLASTISDTGDASMATTWAVEVSIVDEDEHTIWVQERFGPPMNQWEPPAGVRVVSPRDSGYGFVGLIAPSEVAAAQTRARDAFVEVVQSTTMLGPSQGDVILEKTLARWWPAAEPRVPA